MKKLGVFLIFIFLISLNFVSSQEFAHTTQCSEFTSGLTLSVAHPVIAKVGEDVTISIIAYDSNGKRKTSSDTECTIGIANSQGEGVSLINETQVTIIPSPIDAWQGVFTAGNFTEVTNFGIIARCETVQAGGCFEFHFQVTETGEIPTTSDSIFYIILSVGVFLLFLLSLYFNLTLSSENVRDDKGAIIKIARTKYLKFLMILITYPLGLWFLNILIAISENYVTLSLYSGFFGFVFQLLMRLSYPLFVFVFVVTIFNVVKDSNINKKIKKYGKAE